MNVPKRWIDAMGRINHYPDVYYDDGVPVVLSKTWRSRRRHWEYLAKPQELVLYEIRIVRNLK